LRIRFSLEVRGSRQSFPTEGHDLSVEGLCFLSPILLVAGERVGTSLKFRDTFLTPLSLEVRWSRPEGPKHYLIGGEFVHGEASRKALRKLLWQIESGSVRGDAPRPPPGSM
jgi:hypothetical protein